MTFFVRFTQTETNYIEWSERMILPIIDVSCSILKIPYWINNSQDSKERWQAV